MKGDKKMEKDIVFINLEKFHSNKKNQDYFRIHYVCDNKCIIDFISEETYNRILALKPKFFDWYKALFNFDITTKKAVIHTLQI